MVDKVSGKGTGESQSSGSKPPAAKSRKPAQSASPKTAAPLNKPGTANAPRPVSGARPSTAPRQVSGTRPAAPSRPEAPVKGGPARPAATGQNGGRQGAPTAPTKPAPLGAPKPGAIVRHPPRVGAVRPGAPIAPSAPKPAAPPPPVELPGTITVRDLAVKLKVTPIDIIKKLMANGVMANINQPIDFDTASLIAGELGFEVREEKPVEEEAPVVVLSSMPKKHEYSAEELKHVTPRPPVVTVMGHVDHGKTSLLDAIRKTNVVAGEFGGITQHIGAYQVEYNARKITFLDTPGHEAFTAMRARGAKATDIAIIVVAADDGVMPQTREAIDHARAAQVPIIVALNKIDRPNANPERVKQQLSDIGLQVYGGKDEVTVVPVSAKQNIGLEELLENVLLVAELADLRASSVVPAQGVVIESKLDKQQGPMATLLVDMGTLHIGDVVLAGEAYGKVRAMFNERGETLAEASPSTPAAVTGLSDVPPAGEKFTVVAAEQIARARVNERIEARRSTEGKAPAVTLNDLYAKFQEGKIRELNLVIKADVAGSLEPIVSSLEKLGDEKIKVKIIHQGIGAVTTSDVMLASASQGVIIAFNMGIEAAAETLAEQENVDIRKYNIIYKLIEDVDKALKGMLEPVYKDVLTGQAAVLQLFRVKKVMIAGSRVTQGKVARGSTAHVMRSGTEVFSGGIASLKRHTEDVKEVAEGFEFGISLDNFVDFRVDDVIEFYRKERVS
jgi:translation initiation factor IF-2